MRKKFIAVIAAGIMVLIGAVPSMAQCTSVNQDLAQNTVKVMSDNDDSISVYIKGKLFVSNPDEGYEVVIKDDRTFIPLRYVAETLNYQVDWDQSTKGISMTSGGTSVNMRVGDREYTVNGTQKTMDTEPFIKSDRTYVPLRFAAEAFGENVQWDNNNRTAIIGSYSDHNLNSSSGVSVELKKAGIFINVDEAALEGLYIEDNELGTGIFDRKSYEAFKADGSAGGWIATVYRNESPMADKYTPGILLDYVNGVYIQADLPSDVQAYIVDGKDQPYVNTYNDNSDMVKENLKHILLSEEEGKGDNPSEHDSSDLKTYQSKDGWKIKYNPNTFICNESADAVNFVYQGDASGANMVEFSYVPNKQPEEVLYEMTEGWDDKSRQRTENSFVSEDIWSFTAQDLSDGNDSGLNTRITAIEHNGGVLVVEIIWHTQGSEGADMAISDAISNLIDSFEFTDHRPQTEYDYVPGKYVKEYTEKIDDVNVTYEYYVILNKDHTGTLSFQDNVDIIWTSKELKTIPDGTVYNYTIEGDSLLIEQDGEWISYEKE